MNLLGIVFALVIVYKDIYLSDPQYTGLNLRSSAAPRRGSRCSRTASMVQHHPTRRNHGPPIISRGVTYASSTMHPRRGTYYTRRLPRELALRSGFAVQCASHRRSPRYIPTPSGKHFQSCTSRRMSRRHWVMDATSLRVPGIQLHRL